MTTTITLNGNQYYTLAGVTLDDANDGWVPVLTRGLILLPVVNELDEAINTYDLVGPGAAGTTVFSLNSLLPAVNAIGGLVLGTALSWVQTPPGYVAVYVNPAAFYGLPRRNFRNTNLSDVTTNNTAYVDFSSLTLPTRTNALVVRLAGRLSSSTAGARTTFLVQVDGVDYAVLWEGSAAAGHIQSVNAALVVRLSTLGVQSNVEHTITLRWKVSGGTSTFYASDSDNFSVEELQQVTVV